MSKFLSDTYSQFIIYKNDNHAISVIIMLIIIAIFTIAIVHFFRILLISIFQRIKLHKYERQTQILHNHKVFKRASALIAPLCLILFIPYIIDENLFSTNIEDVIFKGLFLYLYFTIWSFLIALLSAINDIMSIKNHKQIRGFIQIIQLAVSLVIFILAISMLLDKSPFNILAGLGASAAVMMFVFKDTLLGFVASVQLTVNDMLQIGDWISMPQYGADGTVIEIGLTAVKVSNWDNTITNIPTYSLVSDAYQNWRGMSDSGGRRVMRSISIDMQSVKFCDDSMLERFSKISLISDFIT